MIERFLLISSSPRREEILKMVKLPFRTIKSKGEEIILSSPYETVIANSLRKIKQAKELQKENEIALSADTIVLLNGKILGKPKDAKEAEGMLEYLSGKTHTVITGFALRFPDGKTVEGFEESKVKFKKLLPEDISWYINTGEPLDKAGSYGIQGIGAIFIEKIEGDFFNVMGLPIGKIYDILLLHNFDIKTVIG